MDFCYQKHRYPNVIKQQARTSANNIAQVDSDASSSHASNLNVSANSTTGLSQEQFTQLVSLLQQSNLVCFCITVIPQFLTQTVADTCRWAPRSYAVQSDNL